MLLSLAQIFVDLRAVRANLVRDANQILAMFHDPASQAIFSLDRETASQVIEGLFAHPAVQQATIGHPDEAPLASRTRPRQPVFYQYLTDPLFGVQQSFSIPLHGRGGLSAVLHTADPPAGADHRTHRLHQPGPAWQDDGAHAPRSGEERAGTADPQDQPAAGLHRAQPQRPAGSRGQPAASVTSRSADRPAEPQPDARTTVPCAQ